MTQIIKNNLTFKGKTLETINHNNEIWITSKSLAKALGYAEEKAVSKLYNSNSDEFTEKMTQLTEVPVLGTSVKNAKTTVRIFSLRGSHLIAMLSRTETAKEFRKWVLDILEGEVKPKLTNPLKPQKQIKPKQVTLPNQDIVNRSFKLPELKPFMEDDNTYNNDDNINKRYEVINILKHYLTELEIKEILNEYPNYDYVLANLNAILNYPKSKLSFGFIKAALIQDYARYICNKSQEYINNNNNSIKYKKELLEYNNNHSKHISVYNNILSQLQILCNSLNEIQKQIKDIKSKEIMNFIDKNEDNDFAYLPR